MGKKRNVRKFLCGLLMVAVVLTCFQPQTVQAETHYTKARLTKMINKTKKGVVAAKKKWNSEKKTYQAQTKGATLIFGNVVSDIAKILGVLGPEENAEDIGAKAMQEGTRPREINESAQDYLDYLRNEVELDREKQAKMDEKDRMACIAAGSALVLATTAEKNDVELTPTYIANASKSRLLSADNILKMAHKFKDNNIEINKFNEYFDNNLSC